MLTLTLVIALLVLAAAATAGTPLQATGQTGAGQGAETTRSRSPKENPVKTPWQWRWKVFTPPMFQRLARCESGAWPPNWRHDSGTYEGAYGFWYGTWDQYKLPGYPSSAAAANPFQQWQVARRLFRLYGYSPWGCYQHAWVRG